MNQETQLAIIKELQDVELTTLQRKGNDYAGDTDVLKNFKEVTEICRILNIDSRTIIGTHLFYIVLKLQRLCNLITNDKPALNEPVSDTILDFRAYLGLLLLGLREK